MTDVATVAPNLATIERVLYERLELDETSIHVLFHAAFNVPHRELPTPRRQQQRLGPYIARLNTKLKPIGQRIVPGVARRTYRLETIATAG